MGKHDAFVPREEHSEDSAATRKTGGRPSKFSNARPLVDVAHGRLPAPDATRSRLHSFPKSSLNSRRPLHMSSFAVDNAGANALAHPASPITTRNLHFQPLREIGWPRRSQHAPAKANHRLQTIVGISSPMIFHILFPLHHVVPPRMLVDVSHNQWTVNLDQPLKPKEQRPWLVLDAAWHTSIEYLLVPSPHDEYLAAAYIAIFPSFKSTWHTQWVRTSEGQFSLRNS